MIAKCTFVKERLSGRQVSISNCLLFFAFRNRGDSTSIF